MNNTHMFCLTGWDDRGKSGTSKAIVQILVNKYAPTELVIKDDKNEKDVNINNCGDVVACMMIGTINVVVISGGDPKYRIKTVLRQSRGWLLSGQGSATNNIIICTANTRTPSSKRKVEEIADEFDCKCDFIEQPNDNCYIRCSEAEKQQKYSQRAAEMLMYLNSTLNLTL